jgi:hypothetical protein
MRIRALPATVVSLALLALAASPAAGAVKTATIVPTATATVKTTAAGVIVTLPRTPSLTHTASLGNAASSLPHVRTATTASTPQATIAVAPVPVPASEIPPAGRHLSADRVLEIAEALPKMRAVRKQYPGSYGGAYFKGPERWQVSFFSAKGAKEIGQVIIADASGRVLEQWTGFQVAWTMARGYPGAFGEHVNALYVWIPLCLLFFVPFFDWRRPFSLLHLDLLVLLSFSVSLAFFNHAHIYASVPLTYPPLLYLLARMLALLRRGPGARSSPGQTAGSSAAGPVPARGQTVGSSASGSPPARGGSARPLRLLIPAPWLAIGIVSLLGFRIALNVTDANVIDVGYAGVIGASKVVHGDALYGHWPADNEHGDTYGPVNYEAYVPFEQLFGWSGTWDDLPAAHAASVCFDLLAVALLFLIGRRMRGPTLGIALAYAWVSFPFTLFALESDSNDTLVAVMILAALYFAGSPPVRGAFAALAGLTKFAPLALAPLLATHGLREQRDRWVGIRALRSRSLALFLLAFLVTAAIVSIPALAHDSLNTIFQRTLVYQSNRGSPFSVWGLYGLPGPQLVVQLAALALAVALAVLPRRDDLVGLAAACAAVIIAVQLGIDHWFYLYIPWFFPLVMIALLARLDAPAARYPWDGDRGGEVARDRILVPGQEPRRLRIASQ